MKSLVLTIFVLISLGLWGQSPKNNKFKSARIIAIDSTQYHESITNMPKSYFLLIEILDEKYDTTLFCRRRFVSTYEAKYCYLKEGSIYELDIEKQSLKIMEEALIANYKGLLKQNNPPCNDPIFYQNNQNRFLIVAWKEIGKM
jgi:hypothetical protein